MVTYPRFWYGMCLVVNIISGGSCIWLLVKLLRSRSSGPQFLNVFRLQFQSLAIADTFFHFGFAASMFLACVFPLGAFRGFEAGACVTVAALFWPARMVSVLHELTIALYCLSIVFKMRALLRILGKSIICIWLVGLMLGVSEVFLFRYSYNPEEHLCTLSRIDLVALYVILGSLVVTIIIYAAMFIRARKESEKQRGRMRRLSLYPLNFFATYILILIVYVRSEYFHDKNVVFMLAALFESLNGLLNVGVYWRQAHVAVQCADPRFYMASRPISQPQPSLSCDIAGSPPITRQADAAPAWSPQQHSHFDPKAIDAEHAAMEAEEDDDWAQEW